MDAWEFRRLQLGKNMVKGERLCNENIKVSNDLR